MTDDAYINAFVIHTDEPLFYLNLSQLLTMSFSTNKRNTQRDAPSGSSQSKVRRVTNGIEDGISPNVKQYIDLKFNEFGDQMKECFVEQMQGIRKHIKILNNGTVAEIKSTMEKSSANAKIAFDASLKEAVVKLQTLNEQRVVANVGNDEAIRINTKCKNVRVPSLSVSYNIQKMHNIYLANK